MAALFKILFISVFLLIFSKQGQAQQTIHELSVSQNPLPILNKKTNRFLVFDDSTYFHEYWPDKKKWIKRNYTFESHESFKSFKSTFYPLSTDNGTIYFVYYGNGEVYSLINDTIKRIDLSFKHRNQYNGNYFTYQNTIYCFGGEGLFTQKNILVYYNTKDKEWYQVNNSNMGEVPDARKSAYYQVHSKFLYIFLGASLKTLNDLWRFDLEKLLWKKMGESSYVNDDLSSLEPRQFVPSYYFGDKKSAFRLDFHENKLERLIQEISFYGRMIIPDTAQSLFLSLNNRADNHFIRITNISDAFHPTSVSSTFYKPIKNSIFSSWNSNYTFILFLFVQAILLVLIIRSQKNKTTEISSKQENLKILGIILSEGSYFINGFNLNQKLSTIEYRILTQFIQAENYQLEVSTVNSFFETDSASIESVKKRRESCMKSLREKIAIMADVDANKVFFIKQSDNDKRIRILQLNPELIFLAAKGK